QLVEPGQSALELITQRFGRDTLLPDGNLNRQRLREIIFADELARADLERIMHPQIRARMRQQAQATEAPYAILAIPLLFEKGLEQIVDRILVIDCSLEQQIQRTSARDGVPPEQARSITDTQVSRSYRVAAADDLIDNSGSLEQLMPQVVALHKKYLALPA
ncbi:MAG: dephospho-CoA kinase, partial [Gammaproteobacteria bacterium]|nr:dephospho-CoA kinase [Gammaproteobacteria bacterium]